MNKEEHIIRHEILHRYLDELLADFICHTGKLPSESTIIDLLNWSSNQTENPTEEI